MERLMTPFYSVMYKYRKHFSEHGVRANINTWLERKAPLITLLRRHPNWDENALAIVFQITESREIERRVVDEKRNRLIQIAESLRLDPAQVNTFRSALSIATSGYSASMPENVAERIKGICDVKCVAGQKSSRVINRLCRQYGVDRHPDYNAVFAQLSDALNPITVNKKALLSVHPCDYLEMSSRTSSWSSCHDLDGGGYMAGCLSYMTDAVSMIFYTVDNDVASEYYKVARRGRQVFCYTEGLLLQSRLYPNDNADAIALYRNLVQTAVADCLEQPNQWVLKKKRDDISHFLQTADGSKQYPDYSHIGTLSLLKSMEPGERIVIGSRPVCVCCGGTVTSSGRLKCNCAEQVVCSDCGETVSADQARYHDETWLCNGCLRICAHCGHHTHEELIPAFDGRGNVIRICQDCYATALAPCAECCVQAICSLIQGNRFCQKSNEAISQPAAAPALRAA